MKGFFGEALKRMKYSETPSLSIPLFSEAINISIINNDCYLLEEN